MVSLRLLMASIALLAVPLASAAPAPTDLAGPEPVEVYGCFNGGVTVVVLGQVELQCVGAPLAASTAAPESVEVYDCFNGGVTGVVLGRTIVECFGATAAAGQPVEVRQCDHWGNSVVLLGKYESPCITTGCSPMCATTAAPYRVYGCMSGAGVEVYGVHDTGCVPVCNIHCETAAEVAAPDPHLRTCSYHPRGVQLHNGEQPIGPCILLPDGGAQASDAGPLWGAEPCPEGEGSRLFVLGKQVTECGPGPATVDLRCTHPAHGVQVYVDGEPATRCVPLPHGV